MKIESTSNEKAVADSINLHFDTRGEIEQGRTDFIRFDHAAGDYPNEASLNWFQDETLKWLFREVCHLPAPNIESLLNEALQRSNDSPRVKQVVDKLRERFNLIAV